MPIYDIAGLKVEMAPHGGRTDKQAVPYLAADQSEGQHADIRINVDDKRVEEAMREHPELNQDDWKYMLTGSDFYTSVLKFDGILLHSSCIVVDGVAYAFSADSGTGKSTHTQLWLKRFGDRAHILNDDKPAALRGAENTIIRRRRLFLSAEFAFWKEAKQTLSKRLTQKKQFTIYSAKRCAGSAQKIWKSFLMLLKTFLSLYRFTSLDATYQMKRLTHHTTQ